MQTSINNNSLQLVSDLNNNNKKKKKLINCCDDNNNVDRISHLPDPLLHHILSFLNMKQAVQTSILSTRWRYLWTSLPTLNFNFNRLDFIYEDALDFVDRVLFFRDNTSNIQKFHFSYYEVNLPIRSNHLNTWILASVRCKVQELSIHSIDISDPDPTPIPDCLWTCKSLKKLELRMDCENLSTINPFVSFYLPWLKTLHLASFYFNCSYPIEGIFLGCPVLETFILTNSDFHYVSFNISSRQLKHLTLEKESFPFDSHSLDSEDVQVKLYAPSLTSFVCKDYMSKNYSLHNFSSLVMATIDMEVEEKDKNQEIPAQKYQMYAQNAMKILNGLHNVKDLTLSSWFLQVVSGALNISDRQSPQFCNLKCLKLKTQLSREAIQAITYLLQISPNIETLFLKMVFPPSVGYSYEAGLSMECLLYHLKFVEIRGIIGHDNELKFVEILVKNAKVLEKLTITFAYDHTPGAVGKEQQDLFIKKLYSFPRASTRFKLCIRNF